MEYSEALKALQEDPRKFFERGMNIVAVETRVEALKKQDERLRKLSEGRTLTDKEIAALNEIGAEVVKGLAEVLQIQREIKWAIYTFLTDPELQTLFFLRYFGCDGWARIGEKMYMSGRWAYELHKKGLRLITAATAAAAPETC